MKLIFSKILLVCLFIGSITVLAQQSDYDVKPPWVNGDMPKLNTKGNYKVVHVDATTIEMAKKLAKEELVKELLSAQGVNISSKSVSVNDYKKESGKKAEGKVSFHEETHVESDGYKAVFANVDEYYQYKNGTYQFWALYLVSANATPIKNLPNMAYKLDNGAWRSVIVPGWGQFHQKRYMSGIVFLGGEVALLSSAFYFKSKYSSNNTHSLEASSVSMKQKYRDRANKYNTYSLITFGAAAGWYIYNLVDAFTSKKGTLQYDYGKMNLAFYPSLAPTFDNNMCMMASVNIKF